MTTTRVLLLGATGGIGSQTLLQLLGRGIKVTAIVRSEARLPGSAKDHHHLTTIVRETGAIDLGVEEMAQLVRGCGAVVSCLGHNTTQGLGGIFGHPRTLCEDTTKLVCDAIKALQPERSIKYIVVNTALVDHPDGSSDPPRGWLERVIFWLLEKLLPPHLDNVKTSHYLYNQASSDAHYKFCVVRPDSLVDVATTTTTHGDDSGNSSDPPQYTVHETLQNGLFNAGTTTRANVGHFMADLVTEQSVWEMWRGKFPQILDVVEQKVKNQ